MKKRILSVALTLCMALTLLPTTAAFASEADGGPFDSILRMDQTAPSGFDPDSTENPYGYGVDEPFMLSTQSELLHYASFDRNDTVKDRNGLYNHQNALGPNWEEAGGEHTGAPGDLYSYVQAVAFDATGSGRDDHVAFVGYRDKNGIKEDRGVYLWVMDKNGVVAGPVSLGTAKWTQKKGRELHQYQAGNFFGVTAGRYNPDEAKDHIVVWAALDGDGYGLQEFSLKRDRTLQRLNKPADGPSKEYLHAAYRSSGIGGSSDDRMFRLNAAVDTGDFNGDGIDDLAVVSYTNNLRVPDGKTVTKEVCTPELCVAFGGSGNTILGASTTSRQYESEYMGEVEGAAQYKSMTAPGLSCGDTDGDGRDEIVLAGIDRTVRSIGESAGFQSDKNNTYMTVYDVNNQGLVRGLQETLHTNQWTSGGLSDDFFQIDPWQPMVVECVAINGKAPAAYIFVNGDLYAASKGAITAAYQPEYFQDEDSGAESMLIAETYIASVAAGNFDGNDAGREQVAFVVGLKEKAERDYAFIQGMIQV